MHVSVWVHESPLNHVPRSSVIPVLRSGTLNSDFGLPGGDSSERVFIDKEEECRDFESSTTHFDDTQYAHGSGGSRS